MKVIFRNYNKISAHEKLIHSLHNIRNLFDGNTVREVTQGSGNYYIYDNNGCLKNIRPWWTKSASQYKVKLPKDLFTL